MGDWGGGVPGGDLNGNGKFDPGDFEIWQDIEHGSRGGGGNRGNGGGCGGWLLFLIICMVLELFVRGLGTLVFFVGAYFYWMSH